MRNRVALGLGLLVVLGMAAIFAAGPLGIQLPWTIAVTEPHTPTPSGQKSADKAEKSPAQAAIEETAKALGSADAPAPAPGSVAIDISRIAPDGTSVFAGRAEPDTYVILKEGDKVAGSAKVDANGDWVLSTDHKFASPDPKLSYEASKTAPPEPEKTEVAKAVPAKPATASAANDVMRKFENLVEAAREEAKKAEQAHQAQAEAAKTEAPKATTPDAAESRDTTQTANSEPPPTVTVIEPAAPADKTGDAASRSSSGSGSSSMASSSASSPGSVTSVPQPAKSGQAGVKTDVIPVPIMFVYNESKLTPEGERAAALLLEYLTLKHLTSVELTGHADERGTDNYNYDLSRERLETVSKLLKDGGFGGDLKLTPKGKSEPYSGVDRSAYSGEALYQLDRRVELRVTR